MDAVTPKDGDPFAPLTEADHSTAPARNATSEVWEPALPAPHEPPEASAIGHWKHGPAASRWVYRDVEGAPLFAVARFNLAGGGKETLPYTFGRRVWTVASGPRAGERRDATRWHFKRPKPPLPLYGLDLLAAWPDSNVLLVEGEKTADATAALFPQHVAMTSQGGSKAAAKGDWTPLAGRNVVIWPDHDRAGADYARDAMRELLAIGAASVRVVQVPEEFPEGWDLADQVPIDWHPAGGEDFDPSDPAEVDPRPAGLLRLIEEAPSAGGNDGRPVIQVAAGQIDVLATQAERALLASGLPVFQRGRGLVRPIRQEVPASRGRMTVAAGLKELAVPGLLDLFAQAAQWERFDKRSNQLVAADPPAQVASILLSRAGEWHLPPIAGVITTPTLRPDGSILSAAGYDAATRLYVVPDPDLQLPTIPEAPSREAAAAALALLDGLLDGFPFVTPVDRAVALSALLTPVVRGTLSVAPLHAFRASTAGTGKSYLADLASAITTGRPCPVVAAGSTDEETEKRLAGLLLAGFPLLSLDNVNGELGGDLLCQAIERPLVRIRPLGRSDIVEIESRATVFATGNALRVRGDMVRRTVVCTLDAGMERPELRTFDFDPVARVLADRGRYVAAALTIVRAYIAGGCLDALPPLASFEDWSGTVRSALVWLGCADPCVSMEAAREDDPELAELREVIGLWREHIGVTDEAAGRDPIIARNLVARAESRTPTQMGEPTDYALPDLRDALLRIAGERGTINMKRLGRWLMYREGRIVDGFTIRRRGDHRDGVARWALQQMSDSQTYRRREVVSLDDCPF